ncbi:sigma-70 family RNA polymerase sigma factor [Pseudomonas japonica]|uniref:RNA polymerase sigma factor for flagellar operon FliA n=1 Tax=Pseudomonas japonica TaxID=256466 RepID=A0A239BLY4_9PSED|nr:sigma-70 family RNA polymerase sigma factor [Pseudomonas japonica]SNS08054.1 RNA polymerase sigma factor for flagellar operon FliA [Pseudomonas japonica]
MDPMQAPFTPANDEEQALWREWQALRSADARARLFFHHAPWARTVAGYFYNRYPHPLAEWNDYLSLTSQGLLQAIDGFDPLRQVRFRTYAEPFLKGAVIKGLAAYIKDQRPVSRDRLAALSSEDRFSDTDSDLELVVNSAVDLAFGYFLELGVIDETPPDNNPLNAYVQQDNDLSLSLLVERLPERERQIIVGHYYQQLSFVQLAELLGVGKSRVSQLHGQALKRIRQGVEGMGAGWEW